MLLTAGSPEPAAARWPLIHCCQASAESIPGTHAACDATEKLTSPKSIFSKSPRAFVYGYVLPGPRCCDRGRRRKRCAAVLRLFGRAPRLLLLFAVQAGSGGVYIKLRYFHRHEWMLRHHALNIRKFTFDSWSKKKAGTSSSYPPDFVWLARHVCHCRHGISTVVAPPLFLATKSLVPGAGIEPARLAARDFESRASTYSAIPATQARDYDDFSYIGQELPNRIYLPHTASMARSPVEPGGGSDSLTSEYESCGASSTCPRPSGCAYILRLPKPSW